MTFTRSKSDIARRSAHASESGYILLTLILFVALLAIAAASIAPSIVFEARRDREEELIHRGVQYSRAIKHYYTKFNRYPTKIEDLESTNNIRFLRKRYKDPITGNDFKLLYLSQIQTMGIGAGGGLNPTANPAAGPGGPNSPLSGNSPGGALGSTFASAPAQAGAGTASTTASSSSGSGTDSTNPSTQVSGDSATSNDTNSSDQKVYGGGPIAGVVSTSKLQSIREFNKKDHYNQWLFIYDPTTDRGGLLNTPAQPPLQGATPMGQQPSGLPQPGAPGSAFGNQGMGNQGFGNQGSFGSNPPQPPQGAQPQGQPLPQQ